jgi:tRNA-dihydrouridine synthase
MAKIGNINLGDFPLLTATMEDVGGPPSRAAYRGSADWTLIGEEKDNPRIQIPLSGNGYICTPELSAVTRAKYGAGSIKIGRAGTGYPGIFSEIGQFIRRGEHLPPPTVLERVRVCKKHLHHSTAWKGGMAGILEMRRHYTSYSERVTAYKRFQTTISNLQDTGSNRRGLRSNHSKIQGPLF